MRRFTLLGCVALAAACTARPAPRYAEARLELPEAFAAAPTPGAGAAPSFDAWWESLGDPELAAAVREAFEHNRDLAAAAARVEVALAEARVAGAARAPRVALAADAGRRRQNFIGLPVPGGEEVLSSTSTSFGVGLEVAWEADLWGRLRGLERAADAETRASALDLAAAHLSLAGQVAKAWFALAEARAQAALAESSAASYRAQTEVLRERFALGRAAALDLHLLANQLAVAEAALEGRREEEVRALRRIELLLGRVPRGSAAGSDSLPDAPPTPPPGLPAELAWRRPDLAAAHARLMALDARLDAARAELLPALRLTGSAGRRTGELIDLFDSGFDVWSLATDLVQPLFEGGRLRARVDAADARARAALAEYAQAYLVALADVEAALAAEEPLARRAAHLERAAQEAAAARETAEDRYFRGLVDVLALLEAQRRDLAAQAERLALRRRRLEARVDLFLALGGGFGVAGAPQLDAFASDDPPTRPAPDAGANER